jgi:hypothetical protein
VQPWRDDSGLNLPGCHPMPGDMLDIVVIPIKIVPVEHVAVLYSSISYGIYRLRAETWVACSPGRVGEDSQPVAYTVMGMGYERIVVGSLQATPEVDDWNSNER